MDISPRPGIRYNTRRAREQTESPPRNDWFPSGFEGEYMSSGATVKSRLLLKKMMPSTYALECRAEGGQDLTFRIKSLTLWNMKRAGLIRTTLHRLATLSGAHGWLTGLAQVL